MTLKDTLFALLTRQNNAPSSDLERLGDRFIAPMGFGFARLKFASITKNNRIFTYDVPYDVDIIDSRIKHLRFLIARAIGILLSPLAIIGFVIKLVALINSRQMRNIYLLWEKPAEIEFNYLLFRDEEEKQKARIYNNENILKAAIHAEKASLLLDDIATRPEKWLIHYIETGFVSGYGGFGNTNMSLTPQINECVCRNSGNFNRFLNQRRQNIEKRLTQDLSKNMVKDRLSYLSLGANGFLQELMIARILFKKKVKVDMHLVDPEFKIISTDRTAVLQVNHANADLPPINKSQLMVDFISSAAKEKDLDVTISFYRCIDDVPSDQGFDIVTAIDYDDLWNSETNSYNDVRAVQSRLNPNGHLYLAYKKQNFVYTLQGCIDPANEDPLNLTKEDTQNDFLSRSTMDFRKGKTKSPIWGELKRSNSWPFLFTNKKDEEKVDNNTYTNSETININL